MEQLYTKIAELENRINVLEEKEKRRKKFMIIRIIVTLVFYVIAAVAFIILFNVIYSNYLNMFDI